MIDDKNKDPKAKPAAGAPLGAAQPKKPTPPKPSKEAMREADLFPADEEEEDDEEEETEASGEALFGDESAEEDAPLETVLGATDTSERIILVVDEEGQRRNETVAII